MVQGNAIMAMFFIVSSLELKKVGHTFATIDTDNEQPNNNHDTETDVSSTLNIVFLFYVS